MKLINKEEALAEIVNEIRATHSKDTVYVGERVEEIGLIMAFDIIKNLPTVESRPTGKWIMQDKGIHITSYKCSECGRVVWDDTGYDVSEDYPYCNCGAAMIGGNNDA